MTSSLNCVAFNSRWSFSTLNYFKSSFQLRANWGDHSSPAPLIFSASIVKVNNVTHFFPTHTLVELTRRPPARVYSPPSHSTSSSSRGKRRLGSGTYISRWDRAGSIIHLKLSQLIYSSSFLSIQSAAYHTQPLNFSDHQIIMASQKMALLAVAAGLLYLSALLNWAEASVSASQQQQSEIDTCVHS